MSRAKKKRKDIRSAEKLPDSKAIVSDRKGRQTGFTIVAVVIAIILIVVGIFYYQDYVVPFHRTIITVDDTTINVGYLLKRIRVTGTDTMTMFESLTNEQLVRLGAPRYGIEVGSEDIDQELRRIARGSSETISESEFKEWYRQQLNESGFSDSEYREIVGTALLANRLHEYLAEGTPTTAEQAHLHIILVETLEEAEEVRARWEAGEDFADLAREVSMEWQSKEEGGDLGWLPRGILSTSFDYAAFQLSSGEISQPLLLTEEGGYYIFMVSEKDAARELTEEHRQVLKDRALEYWLLGEVQFHEITYNFDSEIHAWINWQLSKK